MLWLCILCSLTWFSSAYAEGTKFAMSTTKAESDAAEFTVTLKSENVKDLYAFEAKFNFDSSQLELVKAEAKMKGFSVSPIIKGDEITIAHTKIGKADGEHGDLDIGTLTFRAKSAGKFEVDWTSMKILSRDLVGQDYTPNQSVAYTKIFSDLVGHWAKKDVMEMVAKKVVEGMDSNRFAPNNAITRAQFATLIVRALGLKAGSSSNPFKDVKSGAWYEDAVKQAYAAGIINGTSSSAFAPEKSITREEMSVMLTRAKAYLMGLKAEEIKTSKIKSFNDEGGISDWAKTPVQFAVSTGLMQGRSASLFAPKQNATRAESAVVIKRLLSNSGK